MDSLKTIIRSIVVAQRNGTFSLADAAVLYEHIKEIKDTLPSKEVVDTLVRAANAGQKSGSYTLEESSIISKAIADLELPRVE